jgi:hypothetical protein
MPLIVDKKTQRTLPPPVVAHVLMPFFDLDGLKSAQFVSKVLSARHFRFFLYDTEPYTFVCIYMQAWYNMSQKDSLWQAVFAAHESRAFNAAMQACEEDRETAWFPWSSSSDSGKKPVRAPATLEECAERGLPFCNWKEACIAYRRHPWSEYYGSEFSASLSRKHVKSSFQQIAGHLKEVAHGDAEFACSGEIEGDPEIGISLFFLLLIVFLSSDYPGIAFMFVFFSER